MASDLNREIGRHDEAIQTLKNEVHAMRQDVHEIKEMVSETKGGIRMLIAVGSVGGAIGATFTKFITTLKGG